MFNLFKRCKKLSRQRVKQGRCFTFGCWAEYLTYEVYNSTHIFAFIHTFWTAVWQAIFLGILYSLALWSYRHTSCRIDTFSVSGGTCLCVRRFLWLVLPTQNWVNDCWVLYASCCSFAVSRQTKTTGGWSFVRYKLLWRP